ncbi:MAG TPA: 3-hydroxybutyryl-CoA dehydrogenase, partial [Gemmatimonadetes bacterium]|nr:3-hydroxybutyryl-CoA dehydrogenase [Gemmatimonadota bacterium]
MDIRRVSVVGCGLMGSGIAEVAAKSGFDVTVLEVDDEVLERGKGRIKRSMDRAVEKEKLTLADREAAWDRLHFT